MHHTIDKDDQRTPSRTLREKKTSEKVTRIKKPIIYKDIKTNINILLVRNYATHKTVKAHFCRKKLSTRIPYSAKRIFFKNEAEIKTFQLNNSKSNSLPADLCHKKY